MAIAGVVNPNAAASAYSNSQNITGGITGVGSVTNVEGAGFAKNDSIMEGAGSFSDFMSQNIEKSIDTMKQGEVMSAKAVTGEANLTDVVQAITAAELTLQTVVAVRDKMISAYQDIMRMPI